MRVSRGDVNQNRTVRHVKVQSQVMCPIPLPPPQCFNHSQLWCITSDWQIETRDLNVHEFWRSHKQGDCPVTIQYDRCRNQGTEITYVAYSMLRLASRKCPQWMTTRTRNWNSRMN